MRKKLLCVLLFCVPMASAFCWVDVVAQAQRIAEFAKTAKRYKTQVATWVEEAQRWKTQLEQIEDYWENQVSQWQSFKWGSVDDVLSNASGLLDSGSNAISSAISIGKKIDAASKKVKENGQKAAEEDIKNPIDEKLGDLSQKFAKLGNSYAPGTKEWYSQEIENIDSIIPDYQKLISTYESEENFRLGKYINSLQDYFYAAKEFSLYSAIAKTKPEKISKVSKMKVVDVSYNPPGIDESLLESLKNNTYATGNLYKLEDISKNFKIGENGNGATSFYATEGCDEEVNGNNLSIKNGDLYVGETALLKALGSGKSCYNLQAQKNLVDSIKAHYKGTGGGWFGIGTDKDGTKTAKKGLTDTDQMYFDAIDKKFGDLINSAGASAKELGNKFSTLKVGLENYGKQIQNTEKNIKKVREKISYYEKQKTSLEQKRDELGSN